MRSFIFGVVAFAVLLWSCSDSINYPEISPEQKFLFEFEFMNAAWGWMHYGFYIDNEGNVYKFESPLDLDIEDQWRPNSNGYYSETDLLEKYSLQREFIMKIEIADLIVKMGRIGYASKGELSAPQHVMADAGSSRFRCYVYHDNIRGLDRYEEILLLEEGDLLIENLSPDAKYLYNWLKSIHDEHVYTGHIDEAK